MRITLLFILFLIVVIGFSQQTKPVSIHRLQSEYFKTNSYLSTSKILEQNPSKSTLQKRVFGYHPYWGGNNYLNYHWDLLSDLCYFSYEVDPATGNATTIHDWDDSPAVDSALANGVRVHLCFTLFTGHSTFFNSPDAQQTLISNLIQLIQERGAHGINIDVEALPSAYSDEMTAFVINLSETLHDQIPEAILSIASPAVNWSNKFNIPVLKDYIDLFMVMAYDYYWGGSGQAGASSPTFSMVGTYDYNFHRTLSYYQSQGVADSALLMGVPYYAYQWPTVNQYAPSNVSGSGSAYTFANIMNNTSGNYDPENKHREPNSFSGYYAFQTSGWNQCFVEDAYSMGLKFDIVNRRGIAGIGIWALGYDDGYSTFWDLIDERLTEGGDVVAADTIFDSGGPAWEYYDDENYDYTIKTPDGTQVHLAFSYLDVEAGYDTLKIYDGQPLPENLVGFYTGDENPGLIVASSNLITLRFSSDGATETEGWRAVYDTLPVSGIKSDSKPFAPIISPNPVKDRLQVVLPSSVNSLDAHVSVFSMDGHPVEFTIFSSAPSGFQLDMQKLTTGVYFLIVQLDSGDIFSKRFVKL